MMTCRFKQLKEQEAEKAKEASLTNEVDHELKADSMSSANGSPSSSYSSQVDRTSISKMENGEDSVLYNSRRDQQHLDENLEKVAFETF
ncbi:hypothetical protein HanHA300_Chr02g0046881 [Helianthus annuus]|nr:hypothetical protein HanHA300_Chr02g0046881 [Helianthus annuus]KAJ0618201.1 hypothetical protein HanHA89_Chr02g0050501 [Helianthus annuus]KAJ0776663.1 hypothetical protein HanLR1_Chr02g0048251 [Helianthus annuus]